MNEEIINLIDWVIIIIFPIIAFAIYMLYVKKEKGEKDQRKLKLMFAIALLISLIIGHLFPSHNGGEGLISELIEMAFMAIPFYCIAWVGFIWEELFGEEGDSIVAIQFFLILLTHSIMRLTYIT